METDIKRGKVGRRRKERRGGDRRKERRQVSVPQTRSFPRFFDIR